jgi:drug/metabolite transporter (DMT)-like permease
MAWYHYSISTSLSLVGLILCIRWLTNRGYQPKQILLFMVAIALVVFLGIAWPGLSDLYNSEHFLISLLFTVLAGVFASIGHWSDFEAIKRAPNPGYATALRNCSILPVIFLSVFLFNSELSPWKLAGAVVILAGIMGLVVDVRGNSPRIGEADPGRKRWILLSLVALSSYTLAVFAIKKATLLGLGPAEICAGIYIINLVFFAFLNRKEMKGYFADKAVLKRFLPVICLTVFFAVTSNLLNIKGLELTPNPGYHEAIRNTNILLVTLLSVPLFSARLDGFKLAGVVTILLGIILLVVL